MIKSYWQLDIVMKVGTSSSWLESKQMGTAWDFKVKWLKNYWKGYKVDTEEEIVMNKIEMKGRKQMES